MRSPRLGYRTWLSRRCRPAPSRLLHRPRAGAVDARHWADPRRGLVPRSDGRWIPPPPAHRRSRDRCAVARRTSRRRLRRLPRVVLGKSRRRREPTRSRVLRYDPRGIPRPAAAPGLREHSAPPPTRLERRWRAGRARVCEQSSSARRDRLNGLTTELGRLTSRPTAPVPLGNPPSSSIAQNTHFSHPPTTDENKFYGAKKTPKPEVYHMTIFHLPGALTLT